MVRELEYMNMCPPPIIEFATPLDILVSFCNFVFLRKQKTKKLPAFEMQYVCKKALLANII